MSSERIMNLLVTIPAEALAEILQITSGILIFLTSSRI